MRRAVKDWQVVFVGAGNLATNLAKAFHRHGLKLLQVYSRTEESARTLALQVDADWTTELTGLKEGADLYVVALTDAALTELLPEMTRGRRQALWVHTAGSVPMDIWQGHAERYGVFYPMQTFSKRREVDFRTVPLFVEAAVREDAEALLELAALLSDKVSEATSLQRKSLHLAAVFACNFSNHMYALADEVLQRHGLSFDAMLPLIDETARKVHELPPRQAQTGPAVRYDKNVMKHHLEMLADEPQWQEIYRLMSRSIHRLTP
ncbi:MAG: DUF2520 domain-containing protein [Bacteroides sp.]|nr:DUF2520 domain-containing protein [Bacteroides sp.]